MSALASKAALLCAVANGREVPEGDINASGFGYSLFEIPLNVTQIRPLLRLQCFHDVVTHYTATRVVKLRTVTDVSPRRWATASLAVGVCPATGR